MRRSNEKHYGNSDVIHPAGLGTVGWAKLPALTPSSRQPGFMTME